MADVSRETGPPPDPAVLVALCPADRVPLLERYADMLATEGVRRGLIGPREAPRIWDRHLVNCALLAPLVGEGRRVADLGSGAGLPGIVLAVVRPDLQVSLVEPMERRVTFLTEVVGELGLDRVEVVRDRAGQWRPDVAIDVVTARALAPLTKLVGWAMPILGAQGELLAMKGSSAEQEIQDAESVLTRHRARAEVVTSSVPGSSTTTVVRVVAGGSSRIGLPSSKGRGRRRERG